MIKVQCDRCKRDMAPKGDIGYISWCFKKGVDGDLGENILEGQHFCERCMDRIMCIICNFDDEELQEKAEKQQKEQNIEKPKKTGRPRTDPNMIEAILELKKRGYKIREIAEEVQMEEKKVSNILYRYGK